MAKKVSGVALLMQTFATSVCGGSMPKPGSVRVSAEAVRALYTCANRHDMAHLLSPLVSFLGEKADSPTARASEQRRLQAMLRSEQQSYERKRIYEALEQEEIPYLPLKGSVLREAYPESWMRTEGDIDILIPKEHLERAVKRLSSVEGYTAQSRDSHDVSLFSPSQVHLELHFSLTDPFEDTRDPLLDKVWEQVAADGTGMRKRLPDELFYYYHIAHMAKHMKTMGGCGIRPFLDVWVLWHRVENSREAREALLKQGGLLTFGQAAEQLAEVWFSGSTHTEITRGLEAYIVRAGTQGSKQQEISVNRAKRKQGRFSYAMSRVFLNRELLRIQYPVLEQHGWLLPICWVRRWCRLLFGGRVHASVKELKSNQNLSEQELLRVKQLLEALEL